MDDLIHPYACFPLRSEWEATQPKARDAYPSPLRASRDAENAFLVPTAALRLAEAARELSWDVITQGSAGHFPHSTTGRPGALKEVIGLRFGNHPMTDRLAFAIYSRTGAGTWSWSTIMIWGPDLKPFTGCSLADLKTFLSQPEMPTLAMEHWVAGLRKAIEESEAFRKRKASARTAIVKTANDGRFAAAREETRAGWYAVDAAWRSRVADLADGIFTSEEVAKLIEIKSAARGMR